MSHWKTRSRNMLLRNHLHGKEHIRLAKWDKYKIGYMIPRVNLIKRDLFRIPKETCFAEIPVHDKLMEKSRRYVEELFRVKNNSVEFLTLHGEGETDGKRHIEFSSNDYKLRREYVNRVTDLFELIIDTVDTNIKSIILHPGRFSKRVPRDKQILWTAESLVEISDTLSNVTICLESRGGKNQGKVIRVIEKDILLFEKYLRDLGTTRVHHCLDIAQGFIVHGQFGLERLLVNLRAEQINIEEFHVSDVNRSSRGFFQLAQEIGNGQIDWNPIFELIPHGSRILIETLGGTIIFERSLQFLKDQLEKA